MDHQEAGPILNDAIMAQIRAAIAEALQPLEQRIGRLEAQMAILATKNFVEQQITPVRNAANQALAASSAASADARETQEQVATLRAMFQETLTAIQDSTRTVDRLTGQLDEISKQRDERLKAVEADNQRQESLLAGHGKAIGSLNTNITLLNEQQRRIAFRTKNIWEERKKMDKKLDDQDKKLDAIDQDIRTIRNHVMRPGKMVLTWKWTRKNWKLLVIMLIVVALAILAVVVGPEFVQELVRTLSGIQ